MGKLANADEAAVEGLKKTMLEQLGGCTHLDAAAQALTKLINDTYAGDGSVVLARVYATIAYSKLPDSNRAFVDALAKAKGIVGELRPNTPVLSLLGTSGVVADWNDRKRSQGHIGIPLTSASFVSAIPMIARLLTELGIDLAWVDRDDGVLAQAASTGVGGVFYVEDASTTVDKLGRHVIPAQDFVKEHGVKTVFGAGVTYVDGTLVSLIVFAKEHVTRETAERFLPLMKAFKLATTVNAVSKGQLLAS